MLIAVDGNEANVQEKVGVSVYTFNLLKYFQKKADENTRFIIYLKNQPQSDLPQENQFFKYQVIAGKFFWSQLCLPLTLYKRQLLTDKINVFFSPAHYAPRFCPTNLIVTIHDLSYFYYPDEFLKKDLYKLRSWTAYSLKKAKKIIAVSKTTKKDIIKFYNLPEEKIEIVYNGYEKKIQNLVPNQLKNAPYFLYVGTLQPKKNVITLIKAFAEFKKENPDFKLVIVGKKGWLFDEIFNEVGKLKINSDVIFTGYLPDEQVATLYKKAFCFVLPSLYEGFGIPVLEAMSYGCPVISSFTSSLPEIGENSCLYFDPKSPADLLDKINRLKTNHALRNELIKKGRERVKLFSWKTCAEKTLELLKSNASI